MSLISNNEERSLRVRYCIAIALSTLLISGCTTLRLPNQSTSVYHQQTWAQRYYDLSRISQWNIDGAFSIQQPGKTIIAAYDWQQKGMNYRIRIHSSLDIYSVNISGRPGMVTLWRSPRQHYTASTPEQLMQQQLGWQLPLSNLYYWIRGIPAPGAYQADFDTYTHLIALQQSGWHICFSQYTTVGSVDLPRTLQLSNGPLAVKIVVKHWQ
ncbi:lipoprotein insertase outer membrane protein LolB [Coxiella burnetii]|uniref:lipoprotein insertase outer membrane protein LolB n=1 Tax=Coxiella burnetii TaxID=777 RepID=UPI0005952069|nr:lipoprotein insertase outer membrane protein LolB [Coxiella burnetii]ATN75106.1 lipoprotein localization factor LolB [Coxiella burnetii]ATN77016.1 lipoprotein localization factor LolB [Coxiella burnetii]ATN78932.1 lipoprotein localization factor LolB [Coxiella burnetii]ATN80839.1 lipoprotein localization factor LolB [Coxiella burnetii]OYK89449.1 outer membrane lipoprotein LolB [Coxiella burnetii]